MLSMRQLSGFAQHPVEGRLARDVFPPVGEKRHDLPRGQVPEFGAVRGIEDELALRIGERVRRRRWSALARSSPPLWPHHRATARAERPSSAQAPCRRPRPPRWPALFFGVRGAPLFQRAPCPCDGAASPVRAHASTPRTPSSANQELRAPTPSTRRALLHGCPLAAGMRAALHRADATPPSQRAGVLRQTNLRGGGRRDRTEEEYGSHGPFYSPTRAATSTTTTEKFPPPTRAGSHLPRSVPPSAAPSST